MSHYDSPKAAPELQSLLTSLNRLKLEMCRTPKPSSIRPDTTLKNADLYAKQQGLPPPPPSMCFMLSLPKVNISDIDGEEKECSVCRVTFETSDDQHVPPEYPVRLPCQHTMGSSCIRRWLRPFGKSKHCPMCRADVLPLDVKNSEGEVNFEIWLDEVVWADHLGVECFSLVEVAWVRQFRYLNVYERYEDAMFAYRRECSGIAKFLEARYHLCPSERPDLTPEQIEAMVEATRQRRALAEVESFLNETFEIYVTAYGITRVDPTPEELLSEWQSLGPSVEGLEDE